MKKIYVIDFENDNNIENIINNETHVWLADICDLQSFNHYTFNNIQEFFDKIIELSPAIFYSHNLKYDGIFILDYLLKNGYTHVSEKNIQEKQITTLITVEGVFYNIRVNFKNNSEKKKANKIAEFRDSLKKIQGSVEQIAKSFDLPILKGEIDYSIKHNIDYTPTQEEIKYIQHDTEIIARVLKMEYENGLDKLTTASDTFNKYKKTIFPYYAILFPELSYDTDTYIRKSYRGGVVQVSEKYKGMEINENVYCYDVNSMYPYNMVTKLLPYGEPIFYNGEYVYDEKYPLFIQRFRVSCKLKENCVKSVLLDNMKYGKLSYLEDTGDELLELTLTNVDLQLLKENYNIYEIEYIDGYKFFGSRKLFTKYIKPLYDMKCKTKGAEKQLYKIQLNGLYGKFALNPKHQQKIPYINIDNIVAFKNSEISIDKTIYTAISAFITSYSRQYLLNTIKANLDYFVYCDTDSIHLLRENLDGAKIDDKELGAFKLEKIYVKSKYLGQKCYYGIKENGQTDVKIAGCPKNIANNITFEQFEIGNTFTGKLLPKRVRGGSVLVSTDFTIKNR